MTHVTICEFFFGSSSPFLPVFTKYENATVPECTATLEGPATLSGDVLRVVERLDPNDTGKIGVATMEALLRGIGVSTEDVSLLLPSALAEDGTVAYRDFFAKAFNMQQDQQHEVEHDLEEVAEDEKAAASSRGALTPQEDASPEERA